MAAVFLEYAWDMAWCDPCAADPLSADELRTLGVFWAGGDARAGQNVFVTRLHVRYDARTSPKIWCFQQTGNRENFQGRYVLRHAWTGGDTCPAATEYGARCPSVARRRFRRSRISPAGGSRRSGSRPRYRSADDRRRRMVAADLEIGRCAAVGPNFSGPAQLKLRPTTARTKHVARGHLAPHLALGTRHLALTSSVPTP